MIEFQSEEIEKLQAEVARKLGYKLVDHRLELYAVPLDDKPPVMPRSASALRTGSLRFDHRMTTNMCTMKFPAGTAFGSIGQPIRRKEDARLLTGKGRFTDDFSLDGQTYAAMVRSPHPHARIVRIDTARGQGDARRARRC